MLARSVRNSPTYCFTGDLVDIIADELQGYESDDAPLAEVEALRRMLRKAQAQLGSSSALQAALG